MTRSSPLFRSRTWWTGFPACPRQSAAASRTALQLAGGRNAWGGGSRAATLHRIIRTRPRVSVPSTVVSARFTDEGAPPGHMAVTAEITTNSGDGIHELDDDQIYRRVIDGLEAMELLHRRDVRFRRIHHTRYAYVVRTFDYQARLTKALEYISSLGIVSVGRNAEFEYINMDEAIRRGLAKLNRLNADLKQITWTKPTARAWR